MDINPEMIKFLAISISSELSFCETADLAVALFADAWEEPIDRILPHLEAAIEQRNQL